MKDSDVINTHCSRYAYAQPVCGTNFKENLPPLNPIENLWTADTTIYYPEDRGISESVFFGRNLAKKLFEIFETRMKYSKQFLLFILAGGFAAFINIISRVILSLFLGFKISILIAYLFGMIVAFLLTKNFVFSTQQLNNTKAFLSFSLVNLFAVMQTYLISLYLKFTSI